MGFDELVGQPAPRRRNMAQLLVDPGVLLRIGSGTPEHQLAASGVGLVELVAAVAQGRAGVDAAQLLGEQADGGGDVGQALVDAGMLLGISGGALEHEFAVAGACGF